jgi:hypothetical protein
MQDVSIELGYVLYRIDTVLLVHRKLPRPVAFVFAWFHAESAFNCQ